MFRFLLLTLTGFLFLAGPMAETAQAQNLFLSPNKSDTQNSSKKSPSVLPKYVVPQTNTKRTTTNRNTARTSQRGAPVTATSTKMNTQDFAIFNQLGDMDLGLLQGGVPQSQEEIMQMAAALNMPLVSDILSIKSVLEQAGMDKLVGVLNSL